MSDAQQSGLSDHEILLEIRNDVKEILKYKPDRREIYSVIGLLVTAGGVFAALI